MLKGIKLMTQGKLEEAISMWSKVVRQFGNSKDPATMQAVVLAIISTAMALDEMDRIKDAIDVYDDLEARFGDTDNMAVREQVVSAMVEKGILLDHLERPEEAVGVYDTIANQFGNSDSIAILGEVARALALKTTILGELGQVDEGLAAAEEMLSRFDNSHLSEMRENSEIIKMVASTLGLKEVFLRMKGQHEAAAVVSTELMERFGTSDDPDIIGFIIDAEMEKALSLMDMDQLDHGDIPDAICEETIQVYDTIEKRFGHLDDPGVGVRVTKAMVSKGALLGWLGRPEEVLSLANKTLSRFDHDDNDWDMLEQVTKAMVNKGVALDELGRHKEALAAYDAVITRFEDNSSPIMKQAVQIALNARVETLKIMLASEKEKAPKKVWSKTMRLS